MYIKTRFTVKYKRKSFYNVRLEYLCKSPLNSEVMTRFVYKRVTFNKLIQYSTCVVNLTCVSK